MNGLRRCSTVLALVGALVVAGSASGSWGEPGASSSSATSVTASTARLNGSVNPNDRSTKYFFEYGPTVAYGAKTSEGSAGSGESWRAVAATISGLQASTTYHFRLVATNSKGTTRSGAISFTTAAAPPPGGDPDPGPDPDPDPGDPPADPGSNESPGTDDSTGDISGEQSEQPDEPQLGKSVVVAPGKGELLVRRPGRSSFVALEYGSELPLGTEVNAVNGSIALTSALPGGDVQTARFGGGRFVIRQGRGGYVDLHLRGRACRPEANGSHVLASASRSRSERRLWGKDKGGRYRTHGKNSHATVRGTRWVVIDTCAGTLTRVSRGAVVVRDQVRKKRVLVEAGEHYLARPRR
jgi:hypothetical protein